MEKADPSIKVMVANACHLDAHLVQEGHHVLPFRDGAHCSLKTKKKVKGEKNEMEMKWK